MKNYGDLEPGLYIQMGDSIKAITPTRRGYVGSWDEVMGSGSNSSAEALAQQVAWVYTAINKRKQQLLEIPHIWMRGEEESDPPFDMPWMELSQQIDESIQLFGQAHVLKQRAGPVFIGVRWLDPNTISPDYDTATAEEGITRYERTRSDGGQEWIPAADILRFMVPGMRELHPGTPASMATKTAASILRGIDETADTFYDNNGLPVMLVKVPPNTSQTDKDTLQTAMRRLYNRARGTKEIRVRAVTNEVEIEPLSFAPKDLDQSPLTDREVEAILAAHDVPKSVVLSDAANFATDTAAGRRFVSAIGARFEYIAQEINRDPDFAASGYTLNVMVQDHYTMKEDEAQRSGAFLNYIQGGSTKEEAYFLVGVNPEDFPDWVLAAIAEQEAEPEPVPVVVAPPTNGNLQNEERQAEVRAFKNWLDKRERPNPALFENNHMNDGEKWGIYLEQRPPLDIESEFMKATTNFNAALERVNNGAS